MFTDDKSIENIQQLFAEFKKFLVLQKEYTKLELTEKLTILLSTLIMILVLTILGMVALFYLLFALAYILEPLVGGLMVSFGIIAGINVLLIAIIYFFRRQLIISPMVNFLANLFQRKLRWKTLLSVNKKCCRKSVTRNKPWRIPPAEFSPPLHLPPPVVMR